MLRKYYVRMYRECYIVMNNRIVIRVIRTIIHTIIIKKIENIRIIIKIIMSNVK